MIKIELSEADLNKLLKTGHEKTQLEALAKLKNFKFQENNCIAFDQSFSPVTTTPQIELSADKSGKLLINILRLADNSFGNFLLGTFKSKVVSTIADKSNGFLHRESDCCLSLDLTRNLNARVGKIAVQKQKMTLEIEIS
ncbi:MAG: hypothetical protein IJW35_03600 [Lentisphaeria bacterium]|nr:hypothetical protein [Lentisphaeria bacterium]